VSTSKQQLVERVGLTHQEQPDFAMFAALTRLRYEYAFGIDTRDFDLLRSVFVEDIDMDFSSYNDRPSQTLTADNWVAGCARLFNGLDATQHTMTNPIIDLVSPTESLMRMAMQAAHFLDGVEFRIGGWYQDRAVLTETGWKLAGVTLNVTWRNGDESIMQRALGVSQ